MNVPTFEHLHGKLVRLVDTRDGEVMTGAVMLAYDCGQGGAQIMLHRRDGGYVKDTPTADMVPTLMINLEVLGLADPPPPVVSDSTRSIMDRSVALAMADYERFTRPKDN